MTIDKIIITLIGLIMSLFTYKFFLTKSYNEVAATSESTILVDGGYNPNVIKVPKNSKISLHFLRKDPSNCLEEIVLPDFGKRAFLPINKVTSIEIETKEAGTFQISCGMNMFHAKIIVE